MRYDSIVSKQTKRRASNLCYLMLACGISSAIAALVTAASCSDTEYSSDECSNYTATAAAVGAASSFGLFCVGKAAGKLYGCIKDKQGHHVDGFADLIETENFTYNT